MANEMDKPNGPVSAALLAGGIGSAAMGVVTLLVELDPKGAFASALVWSKPVGNLSGKSSLAIIAFFLSWVILHFIWKGKETNFSRISMIAIALLLVGLLATFPPFWSLLGA